MTATTGVLVKFTAQPNRAAALAEHLRDVARIAERELGTLLFLVHRAPDEPDAVWLYEAYRDDAARETHEASAEYQAAREVTRTFMAGPPQVFPLSDIAGKGLPAT